MNPALSFLCALALVLAPASVMADEATIEFEDAWIRAAPPVSRVLAGYVRIVNATPQDMVLVKAESQEFGAVQIHEMRMQGGVMQMRPLSEIRVAPGASVELAPGGTHLMLQEPKRELRVGDHVVIDFHFADESLYSIGFDVESR